MSNDFLLPEDQYVQRINPIGQYVEQASDYLAVQKGCTPSLARQFLVESIRGKRFKEMRDPEVSYFERDESFVKHTKTIPLSGYIRDAVQKKEVIVPTFTTYVNPEVEQSLISLFMMRNAKRRGVLKHQAQIEELAGRIELAYNLNNAQDNAKRNNNSMSGVMAALGSIFENPTGHNTLTSMTRSMSSISNALNERMISGNRHYFSYDIAFNNLTAIISTMDVDAVRQATQQYNLAIPTAQDVMECVKVSADQYIRDRRHLRQIEEFASRMSPEQRAAVVYTQDLWHLRKHNPEFLRQFIDDFACSDAKFSIEDPVKLLKSMDGLITNYAHQLHVSTLRGKGKTYSEWDPEIAYMVANSALCIQAAIQKYKSFIQAFLVVRTLPCTTAYINHMHRKSVVLSDTDSTMFSVDDWVLWYFGKLQFDDKAFAVAGSIMFVSTQLISHAMAMLSANMNVARDKLFVLSMKPEFVFPVFGQTPVAKHYFCSVAIKEGGVFAKNKYEIKGVHLKSSASPFSIVDPAQGRMKGILDNIEKGEEINGLDEITFVADQERHITRSLLAGESEYYKKLFVKESSAYTQPPELSNYRFHTMWMDVFAPKYGEIEFPPYVVLKIPVTTTTRTKTKAWLDGLADRRMAERIEKWQTRSGKFKELKTLYLPKDYIESNGIPEEILPIVNTRRVILDLTVINRMTLETLNCVPKPGRMLSEIGY